MSAALEHQAPSQAALLYNVRRQFHTVPPVPQAINLHGKTALVTGSNIGLGLECARHFLTLRPARLIMAVRSVHKGEAAASTLRAEFPGSQIDVWQLDMESFASVRAFATRCEKELDRLHVAVLNAGLARLKLERVKEGKEREVTLQVNYLSTALLAVLLVPKMRPTAGGESTGGPGRLTIVTSDLALRAAVPPDSAESTGLVDWVDNPDRYDSMQQYAMTKLFVTAFTARLAAEVDPEEVIVNCSNPAATRTAFFREVGGLLKLVVGVLGYIIGRSGADAARIYVHSSLVLGKESHGAFVDWAVRPWPVAMYGEQGRRFTEKLWSETLEELRVAGVHEVLKGLGGKR